MASSELSLILNNANANLYPSEQQPNMLSMTAPMGRPPHLSEMTFSSNNNSTMGKIYHHTTYLRINER